jgi:hypothetical protein
MRIALLADSVSWNCCTPTNVGTCDVIQPVSPTMKRESLERQCHWAWDSVSTSETFISISKPILIRTVFSNPLAIFCCCGNHGGRRRTEPDTSLWVVTNWNSKNVWYWNLGGKKYFSIYPHRHSYTYHIALTIRLNLQYGSLFDRCLRFNLFVISKTSTSISSPIRATSPANLILPDLIILITLGEIPLWSKYFSQNPQFYWVFTKWKRNPYVGGVSVSL